MQRENDMAKKYYAVRVGKVPGIYFTWDDCKRFRKGHYILMHSVIFRTKLLKECSLWLPEHTFYVDNIYVFEPLPYVKTMYYLDVNLYRYYIGREGQSVNEEIMISRIDQQIKVNKIMIDYFIEHQAQIKKTKRLYQYMKNFLEIVTTVSSVLLIRSDTEENLEKKEELWQYIKAGDKPLYRWLRHGIMGSAMNLPGKGGRKFSVNAYHIAQKIYKFN